MDLKFREISLPFFLWYILPGLNFIGINIILPILLLNPKAFTEYISISNVLSVVLAALVVGFIVDSLKMYQFTIGYKQTKTSFFSTIAQQLEIKSKEVEVIFDVIRGLSREKEALSEAIATEHSRWVMINHTSKAFYLFAIEWIVFSALVLTDSYSLSLLGFVNITDKKIAAILNLLIISFSIAIGFRLSKISKEHLRLSNEKYILFVKNNKSRIKKDILGKNHN
jgi:hypothetical protein